MGCRCSNIPPNLTIIQVGESEVGLLDLKKTLRAVALLGIEDETDLKNELLRRLKEKNAVSPEREALYGDALLREYRSFARSQRPVQKRIAEGERKPRGIRRFLGGIFGESKFLA